MFGCSIYNSWYNLKERGQISISELVDKGIATVKIIPNGNYTLNGIGKKLQEILDKESLKVKFDDENGSIVIKNPLNRKIIFAQDLSSLLGLIDSSQHANKRDRRLKTDCN